MEHKPRVFVIHESTRIDGNTGAVIGDKDLSPAEEWGTLVHVVPPGRQTSDPRPIVDMIEDALDDITLDDYLLLTGYPEYIAIAGAIASRNLDGRLKMLKWNKRHRLYRPVEIVLGVDYVD